MTASTAAEHTERAEQTPPPAPARASGDPARSPLSRPGARAVVGLVVPVLLAVSYTHLTLPTILLV